MTGETTSLGALDAAPRDDEPETSEERVAVEEAHREIRAGEAGLTTEELERELGLVSQESRRQAG